MIHAETLHLVHRQQHACEKQLVLFLQGKGEPIDDGSENLKKLGYAIEAFGLVAELEKNVVDGAADVGPEVEEFSVYPVQCSFQEVTFSGIFRVEQFEKLKKVRRGADS